jgi:hypothetical protein
MGQLLQIDPCTDALVALLDARLPVSFPEQRADVREASGKDFDDSGQLVLPKCAVRVRFGEATYAEARDISRVSLSANLSFQVVCRYESLRSQSEMRGRALSLAECVMEELAGAKLLLSNGTITEPILIRAVQPVADGYGPVENCYGVAIQVSGYAQHSGVNANPVQAGGA